MFFPILGLLCAIALGAGAMLLLSSLVLLARYRRSGRVAWPRFAVFAAGLLYSPLSALLRRVGRSPQVLDLFLIDAANALMARAFARAGPVRMLVMPQCLRSGECRARLDSVVGYQCLRCGKCALGELGAEAERDGFRFFIVPGDRYAKRLAKQLGADAAIGVACPPELSSAMLAVMGMGVAAMGVPLGRDGCFETEVDVARVKEAMRRCGSSSDT